MSDLKEAIFLDRNLQLLELRSSGHPGRAQSLDNFRIDLFAWDHQLGVISNV